MLALVQLFAPPWTGASAKLLCSWDSLDKNTGVGCHALLQRIFLTQESNPRLLPLLHWQLDSLPLSHLESPFNFPNSILIILIPGTCYLTRKGKLRLQMELIHNQMILQLGMAWVIQVGAM